MEPSELAPRVKLTRRALFGLVAAAFLPKPAQTSPAFLVANLDFGPWVEALRPPPVFPATVVLTRKKLDVLVPVSEHFLREAEVLWKTDRLLTAPDPSD